MLIQSKVERFCTYLHLKFAVWFETSKGVEANHYRTKTSSFWSSNWMTFTQKINPNEFRTMTFLAQGKTIILCHHFNYSFYCFCFHLERVHVMLSAYVFFDSVGKKFSKWRARFELKRINWMNKLPIDNFLVPFNV